MATPLMKRPRLRLPFSRADWTVEIAAVAGLLSMILVLLRYWPALPVSVPRHFNAAGEADAWGGRGSLLVLPAIGLALYTGMTALSRFPHIFNIPVPLTEGNVERQYRYARLLLAIVKAEMLWLFAYIEWRTIQTALGNAAGLGIAFLPVLLIGTTGTLVVYFFLASRTR